MMQTLTDLKTLRAQVQAWHREGWRIALVPTMGALHSGHLALVREAQKHADKVMVSIFVNPLQFGPNEDFSRYPRPVERDVELLAAEGADAVWLPSVEEMYPAGAATTVHVAGLTDGLCGQFRPGHFDGVATVVSKLFLQTGADVALFGEKDYQQLAVIRRMVADLNIPVVIVGVPTVREASGLALSSRNQYLSEQERAIAPTLYAALKACAAGCVAAPDQVVSMLEKAKAALLSAGFSKIDYVELCDAQSLAPQTQYKAPARLIAAVWMGTTRLIDNIPVEEI